MAKVARTRVQAGTTGQHDQRRGANRSGALLVGVLGILLAAGLWALVGVVTRRLYASTAISPLAVGALRLALAAPALLALSASIEQRSWRMERRDWWLFAGYGVATAGYQLGFLAALISTSVTAATLLLTSAPVFVTILAAIFLGERPTPLRALLLAVALAGAALVVLGSEGTGGEGSVARVVAFDAATLRGDALALGAALAYACYYLFSSVLGSRYGGIQVMGVAIGAGACLLLPLAWLFGGLAAGIRGLDGAGWGLVLLLALGSTALAYAIYGVAMRWVPATLASVAALVEPLIAAVLAWRLLGEHLALIGFVGAALLLGGIAATAIMRSREAHARQTGVAPDVAA